MKHEKPAPARMLDLINGYWVSKMLHVAAELEIADHLHDAPKTAAELACLVSADADRLHRLLRALTSAGVFRIDDEGRFSNTELGATLCSGRPDSMRDFALMISSSPNWQAWDELMVGIREPKTPFDVRFGMGSFEYLAQHPEDEAIFARSMASISSIENPAIAAALDLSNVASIMDVGGSGGHLLAAVLEQNPDVRGVLFDMPQVVEAAKEAPYLQGFGDRVSFEGGSFFEAVPAGVDAYMMKYILHDWNDDQCVQILAKCGAHLGDAGRVFVIDTVVVEDNEESWAKMLDINMLAVTGGRERTEHEFASLFAKAGLELEHVVPTQCALSIVVGKPA